MSDLATPAFRHVGQTLHEPRPGPAAAPERVAPTLPDDGAQPARQQATIAPGENLADDRLTGPPPAFEANLLDLTRDIATLIRDIEAARQSAREAYDLAPISERPGVEPTAQ